MNSNILLTLCLLLTPVAQAQIAVAPGFGAGPLNQCNLQPGSGAIAGADMVSNLNGQVDRLINQIQAKKVLLAEIDSEIARDKSEMGAVLSPNVIGAVAEHRQYSRNRDAYQGCKWDGHGAAVGSSQAAAVVPNSPSANPGGRADGNSLRPLDEFCYQAAKINTWNNLAEDGGLVRDEICDYRVGTWDGRPETAKSARCKKGLSEYYARMRDRVALETQINDLDDKVHQIKLAIGRTQDEIAEGTYCPYCHSGSTNGNYGLAPSAMQGITPIAGILTQPGASGVTLNGRIALGGSGAVGGYPNAAYPALVPGYSGVYNGTYGAVPGAVGAGAFGCQGLGNNVLNNGALANPQLAALLSPNRTNGLFANGVGPGFAPVVGNGAGAPQYLPLLAQGTLPLPNGLNYQQQQQQANLPYFARAMNPAAPFTAPYVGAYGNSAAFAGGPLINPNFSNGNNAYSLGSYYMQQQQMAGAYAAFQRSGNYGAGLPSIYAAPGGGGGYIPPGTGFRGTATTGAYAGGGYYSPAPSYYYGGGGGGYAGGGYPYAGALTSGLTIGGSINFGALTIGGAFNTH